MNLKSDIKFFKMRKEDKIIFDILNEIKCPSLPDEYDPSSKLIWVLAVGETLKYDGSRSYALLEAIDNKKYRVKRDFGSAAKIVKVLSIRPYMYLRDGCLPIVHTLDDVYKFFAKKDWNERGINEEPKNYLGYTAKRIEYYKSLDKATLESALYACAINTQIMQLKTTRDYYDNIYMNEEIAKELSLDPSERKSDLEEAQEKLKKFQERVKNEEQKRVGRKPRKVKISNETEQQE